MLQIDGKIDYSEPGRDDQGIVDPYLEARSLSRSKWNLTLIRKVSDPCSLLRFAP
jgi:hypothetical protein